MEFLKQLILNKSFFLGVITAIGIFSKYIFGPNNFLEEFIELIEKLTLGKDINFSHTHPEDPEKDLNKLFDFTPKVTKKYKRRPKRKLKK